MFEGPVDEGCFAVDELAGDRAEVAAIARDGPMVAHDEELVCGNKQIRLGAVVGEAGWNVGLGERMPVDGDSSVIDGDEVAGESDDALDVALGVIVRVAEDDDVSSLDGSHVKGELVDEEAILILKHGKHGGTFDANGLVEKDDDEGGDADRKNKIAHP